MEDYLGVIFEYEAISRCLSRRSSEAKAIPWTQPYDGVACAEDIFSVFDFCSASSAGRMARAFNPCG